MSLLVSQETEKELKSSMGYVSVVDSCSSCLNIESVKDGDAPHVCNLFPGIRLMVDPTGCCKHYSLRITKPVLQGKVSDSISTLKSIDRMAGGNGWW